MHLNKNWIYVYISLHFNISVIYSQELISSKFVHITPDFFSKTEMLQDTVEIYAYAYKDFRLYRVFNKGKSIAIKSEVIQQEKDTIFIENFLCNKKSLKGTKFNSDSAGNIITIQKSDALRSQSSDIDNVMDLKVLTSLRSLKHQKVDSLFYFNRRLKKETYEVWEDQNDSSWINKWIFEFSETEISNTFFVVSDLPDSLKKRLSAFSIISAKKWIPEKREWLKSGVYTFRIENNLIENPEPILKIFKHFEKIL